MNILIVDDEPLARTRLRRLLDQLPECAGCKVDEAADVASARQLMQHGSYQLLLLDIQMPGASGLDLAADLVRRRPHAAALPAVVFVTAHDEHALAAFDHAAVDYLTKPVRRERLAQALERVRPLLRGGMSNADPAHTVDETPSLAVVERGAVLRVPLVEVLYFRSDNKYTLVRTAARHHLIDTPLGELEQRHAARFVRTHRSALVAVEAIAGLDRVVVPATGAADDNADWVVRVRGITETLPISRRQLPVLRGLLRSG
ncbi:MAG: response regulator transcription factor [Burkholderiales bacterium]|nr:response regulator transcription factor [Burkholderiales bacterium]